MDDQENNQARQPSSESPKTIEQALNAEANEKGNSGEPHWREVFHQAFEKARRTQQPVTSRRELGKDKSKSLLVLAVAAVGVSLLFLAVFSSPNKPKRQETRRPGTPDLGRRTTPGQQNGEPGKSITPLLDADLRADATQNNGTVTPEDVGRTAKLHGSSPLGEPPSITRAPSAQKDRYTLDQVDFSDPALKEQPGHQQPPTVPPAPGSSEAEQLRKPSLVFVRSANESTARPTVSGQSAVFQQEVSAGINLPSGTRLVARLEAPASTAVKQPVIAVVEYNYERDGEIVVPAGARAVGQLRQADRNGFVDIKFDRLEMPDTSSEKLDGVAMGLDFKPLKGSVTGKRTGTKFLVHAFTGLGTAAAYLVGNGGSTGLYGPISESALLRERLANNLGIAGDQELNELAFNQNIVVTVPGSTRFYIVLGKMEPVTNTNSRATSLAATTSRTSVPTLDELRQLMQLKQELSAMYQQASTQPASVEAPQQ